MPTKAKGQGVKVRESKLKVKKDMTKLSKNKSKMSTARKCKMRGDKSYTIMELSEDGFTSDEEEDDKSGITGDVYEHCGHFKIEESAAHENVKIVSPTKKRKFDIEAAVEIPKDSAKSSRQKKTRKVEKVIEETDMKKNEKRKKTTYRDRSGNNKNIEEPSCAKMKKEKPDVETEAFSNKNEDKKEVKIGGKNVTGLRNNSKQILSKKDNKSKEAEIDKPKRRKKNEHINEEVEISDTKVMNEEQKSGKQEKINSDNKLLVKEEDKCKKFVGAHISIAGGLYKSVLEAVDMKAKAFGLFLKSQRQWACKPLEDLVAVKFRETYQEFGFSPGNILPHGSYLMNCGSPDETTLQKSRDALVDELQRCEKLGLTLFNFHPGSTCGKISVDKCLDNIAESINQAHSKTNNVITVVENMCCQGHTIGGQFEELKGIIDRVKDKSRIGVCLDTCHAFAAGFDLSTEAGFEEMMSDFDQIVGFKYLKAMHLNDSKGTLGCHLDRHENIGKGRIGKDGFRRIMKHPLLNNIPMILETPCPEEKTYAKEVKMLYAMCDT